MIRGCVFLGAMGRHSGPKGAVIEMVYVVSTSDFFSAIQQGLLGIRPRWRSNAGIVLGVPVAALAYYCLVHLAAGAPNPRQFTLWILSFSLISAAFHLHIMRTGTMLIGQESRSFRDDLNTVPAQVVSFGTFRARSGTEEWNRISSIRES